jgi:hypothetical protein
MEVVIHLRLQQHYILLMTKCVEKTSAFCEDMLLFITQEMKAEASLQNVLLLLMQIQCLLEKKKMKCGTHLLFSGK